MAKSTALARPTNTRSGPPPKALQRAFSAGAAKAREGAKRANSQGTLTTLGGAAAYGVLKSKVALPSPMGVGLDVWIGGAAILLPLFAPRLVSGRGGKMLVQAATGVGCSAITRLSAGGGLAGEDGPYETDASDTVSGLYDDVVTAG